MNAVVQIQPPQYPKLYEAARAALFRCDQIDECQEWSNKAAAMASYARQARDTTLLEMAKRIQARAVRRCGEILKLVPPSPGGRAGGVRGSVKIDDPKATRSAAAKAAGMTTSRKDQALRIASIPPDDFDSLVESANPPSITQLSLIGSRPRYPRGRPKGGAVNSLRRKLEKAEIIAQKHAEKLAAAIAVVNELRAQLANYTRAA
jgi:hypothetical protein